MKARERLYLLMLAILFGAAAVLVGAAALELFSLNALRTSIEAVYGRLEFLLLAVLLLAIAVYFLLSSMRGQDPVETITQAGVLGEVRISFKAVETLVLKAARNVKEVREVKTRMKHTERGLVIFLRAVTLPDQNIPQVTAELQQAVKEYIEDSTGSAVAEVQVLIENVVSDVVKAAR